MLGTWEGGRLRRMRDRALAVSSEAQWRRGLILIGGLAALARVAMILATPHATLFGDPVDYQRHAVSIAGGHG